MDQRAKTIKDLKGDIGVDPHGLRLGNTFWDMTHQAEATSKIHKLAFFKIKKNCASKDTQKLKK